MNLFCNVSAADIRKIQKSYINENEILWLYLGTDTLKRRKLDSSLGSKFKRIPISRLLVETTNKIRHEYIAWCDELNRQNGSTIEWWFSSVASRNIYSTNAYLFTCYLAILDTLFFSLHTYPNFIVVESSYLAKSIMKWSLEKKIPIILNNPIQVSFAQFYNLSLFIALWLKSALIIISRLYASIATKKQKSSNLPTSCNFLIDTFIFKDTFNDNGEFKDRNFHLLYDYLISKEQSFVIHPVLDGFEYSYFSVYRKMRESKQTFIIPEDYLCFKDYISALLFPWWWLNWNIKASKFRGFEMSDIIEGDRLSRSIGMSIQAVLIYRLFVRLKHRIKIESAIDWYENQVIDKALIAGVRNAFPEAYIIGAQIFIHSTNDLNPFPIQSEYEAGVTPNKILGTSEYQCKMISMFSDSVICEPVAALRYNHLYNDDKNISTSNNWEKGKIILVLLPLNLCDSLNIIELLHSVLDNILSDYEIKVKTHPLCCFETIINYYGRMEWNEMLKPEFRNLHDALLDASIVISSNSSSMVEAAAKGIPVIIIGHQTSLTHNMFQCDESSIIKECYSSEELLISIRDMMLLYSNDREERSLRGTMLRDKNFTPVNEKTLEPFIGHSGSYQNQ
jgi:hypothetical protein